MAVAGDVFDDVLVYAILFSHEMSWMRSGTELNQFLRIFLPTLECACYVFKILLQYVVCILGDQIFR